ncbi:MAG: hypothetical protein QCI00_07400, partial [Candidatus Thermoplasmatota archaeon]|nr:hypothetical protein [Candidatus Thermoplasmatota archaeon]
MVIKDGIPPVSISNWTEIGISVDDAFGLNWDWLQEKFGIIQREFIWPSRFMFGPDVRKYYGYTSLQFEVEVISGDGDGWYFDVFPSTIDKTTGNWSHFINLRAQVDKSAADYSIVARLKCTRILSNGEVYGISYSYIPLRAKSYNYVRMISTEYKKEGSPRSIVHFNLDITNEGYYEDVFKFHFECSDEIYAFAHQSGAVINPGATRTIDVSVMLPERLFDPGTANTIEVYVSSSSDRTLTYIGSIVVVTSGMFFPQPLIFGIIAISSIIIIISYIFIGFIDKKDREMYGKPGKPWLIPEEKR